MVTGGSAGEGARAQRPQRVARYKVCALQKRLAELSGQVEVAVIEARQLISWKQDQPPLALAELQEDDRRVLDANHRARLLEVVQKNCMTALKAITQHKWSFPFNSPVDVQQFPDYPKVISAPMDFSTIKGRLEASFYKDPKDWMADVMLVFANAKKYNPPGSDCHLMAQTLQEVCEEKYEKMLQPRLAEEAAATLRDEMSLKKRRAELLNQQHAEAMEAQCASLLSFVAEVLGAIREAKSVAASLCEPVTLEEKQALASTIQSVPVNQLEAIVSFVASRHPPSVSQAEPQASGAGGVPSRKVQLNLGRYDALLLRQLQHLVSTCTAANQQRPLGPEAGPSQDNACAAPAEERAADAPAPGPDAVQGGGQEASAASPPAAEAIGSGAGAGPGQGAAQQEAAAAAEAAAAGTAGAGSGGGGPGPGGSTSPGGAPVTASVRAASVPSAGGSTQRNISDVVTNATATGLSQRAGIRWPGQPVGAGLRPRARGLLYGRADGAGAMSELLGSLSGPSLPQSTKRRRFQAPALEQPRPNDNSEALPQARHKALDAGTGAIELAAQHSRHTGLLPSGASPMDVDGPAGAYAQPPPAARPRHAPASDAVATAGQGQVAPADVTTTTSRPAALPLPQQPFSAAAAGQPPGPPGGPTAPERHRGAAASTGHQPLASSVLDLTQFGSSGVLPAAQSQSQGLALALGPPASGLSLGPGLVRGSSGATTVAVLDLSISNDGGAHRRL